MSRKSVDAEEISVLAITPVVQLSPSIFYGSKCTADLGFVFVFFLLGLFGAFGSLNSLTFSLLCMRKAKAVINFFFYGY